MSMEYMGWPTAVLCRGRKTGYTVKARDRQQ